MNVSFNEGVNCRLAALDYVGLLRVPLDRFGLPCVAPSYVALLFVPFGCVWLRVVALACAGLRLGCLGSRGISLDRFGYFGWFWVVVVCFGLIWFALA